MSAVFVAPANASKWFNAELVATIVKFGAEGFSAVKASIIEKMGSVVLTKAKEICAPFLESLALAFGASTIASLDISQKDTVDRTGAWSFDFEKHKVFREPLE